VIEDNYGLCDWNCGTPAPAPGIGSRDVSALRGGGPLDGGGIIAAGNARIVSNLIRRNCAQSGAGMYLFGSAAAVNNTILRNKGEGAALIADAAFFNIDNNLFWDNGGGNGNVGTGAILADPLLHPDDIHLRPNSPAIDAGDDSWVQAGDVDINGRPRIAEESVDVGADEFIGHRLQIASGDASGPTLNAPAPGPHAEGGGATFRFALPAAGSVTLAVHDVLGRRIAVRAPEELSAGSHRVVWNPGRLHEAPRNLPDTAMRRLRPAGSRSTVRPWSAGAPRREAEVDGSDRVIVPGERVYIITGGCSRTTFAAISPGR
jgi:hypothetical protein